MSSDSRTTAQTEAWEAWKAALLTRATEFGWPPANVDPDAYRDYFADGCTARDAWDEDMQHG